MTEFIGKSFLRNFLLFMLVGSLFGFTSCKGRKQKKEPQGDSLDAGNCKIDYHLPRALISDLRKNEFHFEWFSGKLDCEASDDSSKVNFDVTVRIRRDSVIWMIITEPLMGIQVARVLITKDSVKFIQKLPEEKCFKGDFVILSNLLQNEVDYDMIQSLLVGNSASFYEEDEKLNSSVNRAECTYILSTIRKRKLNKVLSNPQTPPADPLQTITMDPVSFKILKILFIDAQNRTFTAHYSEFAPEDSLMFPHKALFFARGAQKSARLDVTYKKIKLNQPLEFPFNFPDDCQPILIPEQPRTPQPQGQH
ncbi:MAG: DUF4292 domain-containing protein [Bacteroidota bacterium]|nr:DUF4292 domain-containing protein [Bacteroidota bacterium]